MSKKTERNITNPDQLAQGAYNDRVFLDKRKALYEYTTPHYSVIDEVLKHIGGTKILDIGCGGGDFLLKAASLLQGVNFVGMDISQGMFAKAQEHASERGLPIKFIVGDAQSIPFEDQSFDRVVAMHMLYHVDDIEKAIAEISRVVTSDGQVILTTNSLESKPQLRKLRLMATERMAKAEYPDAITRFNLENAPDLLTKYFDHVSIVPYESVIRLTSPDPAVDYFDSMRDFWQPRPEDEEWTQVLTDVRDFVQERITKNGIFKEKNFFGVIVASHSKLPQPSV